MKMPTATYRLQFRNGMSFESAARLAPYLRWLGISHLYASPIQAAVSGSTHGYDVVDHNTIDPALGGREGFERMAAALRREGIGILLDIVPNHMAASMENPWWRSVVRLGRQSPFAGHFDIDWSRRLTLPLLGGTFEQAVAAGEIGLEVEADGLGMRIPGTVLPLAPESRAMLTDGTPAAHLANALGQRLLTEAETGTLRTVLATRAAEPGFLEKLHEIQPWRLICWKDARRDLSYRRFFEVTGLVGVRVDEQAVFADVHRLTLELVREGLVSGLRIDHVDGLSDPSRYLAELRAAVGRDVWIVVEKILGEREDLPDWEVEGTTGYEFISSLADLFVDPDGLRALRAGYARWIGRDSDPQSELRDAKLQMLHRNFEGELGTLATLLGERRGGEAIAELIAGFDVYRTYGGPEGALAPRDRARLDAARARAVARRPDLSGAIEVAAGLLAGPSPAAEFRRRFQQLSGPVMAKALEDTFFYRHHPLVAMNEVGAEPEPQPGGSEAFHAAMSLRLATQPLGLTASATHDTKRGEDARARLHTLSHEPERWLEGIARWRRMVPPADVDAGTEWMLYQALAGVWPEGSISGQDVALDSLRQRFLPFVEKALREAKLKTDWVDQNQAYEGAVKRFASALLHPSAVGFQRDFEETLGTYASAGHLLSRAQLALKLLAPGVPDVYQGTEHEDFSLVDPDNRRMPDYASLTRRSAATATAKQALIRDALRLRRALPEVFRVGDYLPFAVEAPWDEAVIGFARAHPTGWVVAAVVKRPITLLRLREEGHPLPAMTRATDAPVRFQAGNDAFAIGADRPSPDIDQLARSGFWIVASA